MELVNLTKLDSLSFTLNDISVIEMTPKLSVLTHSGEGRLINGFLYLLKGRCNYKSTSNTFTMEEGSLVYLPKGSRHTYTSLTKDIRYIRIDFNIINLQTSKEIIFNEEPYLIFLNAPTHYHDLIKELTNISMSAAYGSHLKSMSLLNDLLFNLACFYHEKNLDKPNYKKILPAVTYLGENYVNDISTEYLSELCFLSQTHFRRLFQEQFGMTPTQYRNHLRIKKACQLLNSDNGNISEISERLGFDSIYYFSKVFKEAIGLSPMNYKNKYL